MTVERGHIDVVPAAAPAAPPPRRGAGLARLLIAILVIAVLWPLVAHRFGGMDDDINVARNPHLNPPTLRGLAYFWTTPQYDLYVPVTYTAWWAVAKLAYSPHPDAAGVHLNPHLFHLLNLLLHAAAALAAYEVLRRCAIDSVWPAAIGALVFALHPVQVESVGWIAGTKDVLAGMLALVALWQYLRIDEWTACERRRRVTWAVGTLAFVLGMLSKPGVVVVPVIAILLDRLVLGRPLGAALRRGTPWLILAIPFVILAKLVQPASAVGQAIGLAYRPLIAADALAFYLRKLVWPVGLGVDYGRTPQAAIEQGWIWWTWVVPLAVAVAAILARRRAPQLAAAVAVFVAGLVPVLGLVPFDFQAYSTVADHYLYLPMLGPALAMTWLASLRPRPLMMPASAAVVAALGALAHVQTRHWADAEAIFTRAAEVNPTSWLAHNQLANVHSARGDFTRAADAARRAVELNPHAYPPRLTLAIALSKLGELDGAVESYRAALRIYPQDVIAHTNLANLLAHRGEYDAAIAHYEFALQSDPRSTLALVNLAGVYEERGNLDEARRHYQRALEIDPASPEARAGLQRTRER